MIYKKAQKEGWPEEKEQLANAVRTKTIEKTASSAAAFAARSQKFREKMLSRLERIADKYPYDATEVRVVENGRTVVYRLRDLAAAYKDLVGELPKTEEGDGVPQVIDDV